MNRRYFFAGFILLIVLAGAVLVIQKSRRTETPEAVLKVDTKEKGPADAPVRILEYSDFQCPACRFAVAEIENLLNSFPGKIRVAFRHFPLPAHPAAPLAHQAAECASEAGKFWQYHDALYEGQSLWSALPDPTESFVRFARDLGMDLEAFARCLSDENIRRKIYEEKSSGDRLKVNSTPTFFINNERFVGALELKTKGQAKIREILGTSP